MPTLRIYSKLYLEQEDESWSARPNIPCMLELPRGQETARWIAHLRVGDTQMHIALGDPVSNTAQNPAGLYLPAWCLNSLGLHGDGEEVLVNFMRCEEFEKATRLSFKVLGDPVDEMILRDILEESLSQLGVVEEGQMIPLPMMDGIVLLADACDPGGAIFLDGNNVALEITQSRPASPVSVPAPVPVPVPVPVPSEEEATSPLIPSPVALVAPVAPVAPVRPALSRIRGCPPTFVPFSGVGRSLRDP